MESLISKLANVRGQIKTLQMLEKDLNYQLTAMLMDREDQQIIEGNLRAYLITSSRMGTIDTDKLEADGVNLEDYRKPSKEYKTLKVVPYTEVLT